MKLTVCIICKNESEMIERCLKSLQGLPVVIVDTGSTDNTVKIAEKYGKVYHHKWNDNFADARNFASDKVKEGYVLSIDADEQLLTPVEDIKKQLEDIGEFNALTVKMKWDDNHSHNVPRIFKAGLRWQGKCHEYITCNPKPSNVVIKYEKSPTHNTDPDRNLRILLNDTDNPRSMFYLANEYYDRNQIEKALEWYKKYLDVGTWRYEIAEANFKVAKCLWILQKGDKARNYCLQAILGNPNFKEALVLMSEMSWPKEAIVWRSFSAIANNDDVLFVRGV